MEWYPRISIRYVMHGDKETCRQLIGLGKKLLKDTIDGMRFQGLKNDMKSVVLPDGSIVQASVIYGIPQITIISPEYAEGGEYAEECWCQCHLAQGFIKLPEHFHCYDWNGYGGVMKYYDVQVCALKSTYVMIENCYPIGFTKYTDGQPVIVMWRPETGTVPFHESEGEGCSLKKCRVTDFVVAGQHKNKFHEVPA